MTDPKDFVLRAKLSEVTGRRSIYYRMSGQIPFKAREITQIAKFFEAYGVTRNDIVQWIREDYSKNKEP